jgi:hypothetical protein
LKLGALHVVIGARFAQEALVGDRLRLPGLRALNLERRLLARGRLLNRQLTQLRVLLRVGRDRAVGEGDEIGLVVRVAPRDDQPGRLTRRFRSPLRGR